MTDTLPDHLRKGLKVVFCGTAAGTTSALLRVYYAGRGNVFWRTLVEIGLTSRQFAPNEFCLLNDLGIGLTDIAKKVYGPDSSHVKDDFDVAAFTKRMLYAAPVIIAFNGKKAASVFFEQPTRSITYGLQMKPLEGSKLFVVPSTSGSARRFWDRTHWFELARLARVAG
jgi:TDG/mug DNA glycosylase family protein